MNVQRIDHVEFSVGDAQQSAFYLCTALGFQLIGQGGPETGLANQRSLLLRHGDIRLLLTSGLSCDHEASQSVRSHGDGVSCIALGTSDACAAFENTVRRGATAVAEPVIYQVGDERVVLAEVSGFGDVRHRFVERHGGQREFLPGAIDILAEDPERGGDLLSVIDHIAVCLPAGELGPTVRYYQDVFGFKQIFEEYIEVGNQGMNSKVIQSYSEQVTLTLIEPDTARSAGQIDRFLASHGGAGVQHLAFLTDDIIRAVRTFEKRGVRFLNTTGRYYDALQSRLGNTHLSMAELRRANVLADRDHWGDVFQIFTQSMHVRGTYFSEIIERHGAKTFGSGNIKALYEAVQAASLAVN